MTHYNGSSTPPAPGLHPANAPGLSLGDIYYVLFRHKGKIAICALLGFVGAGLFYWLKPAPYGSEAKLFIRYVLEGRAPGPVDDDARVKSPDQRGETIISSELQVITSLDLASEVVARVGPEKILAKAGGGESPAAAAALVRAGLNVDVPQNSSVLRVTFEHPDPAIVQPVLREVVSRYFTRHKELHGALGFIGDSLTQETDQLRARLAQTEEELLKVKNRLGVVSLDQAKLEYHEHIARLTQEIQDGETELARRSAVMNALAGTSGSTPAGAPSALSPGAAPSDPASPPEIPATELAEYGRVLGLIEQFRLQEKALLSRFTENTPMVQGIRMQITEQEKRRTELEASYPRLADDPRLATVASGQPSRIFDFETERAQLVGLESGIANRKTQLTAIETKLAEINAVESQIRELERRKDRQELDYRTLSASLEQARIGEALGAGRVSNISAIQEPSPPYKAAKQTVRTVVVIAVGGLALGLGWAFLIEMYLDRTLRRPFEVERRLGIPLFLSIPDITGNNQRRLVKAARERRLVANGGNGRAGAQKSDARGQTSDVEQTSAGPHVAMAAGITTQKSELTSAGTPEPLWSENHPLHPFYETLRDRLIGYFESRNLTHKPKLVAVTSMGANAGVTNLSAGLASCLSETGEGNVLLVDLTAAQGSAQEFFKGKAVCGLEEMFDTRSNAQVQDKLFVVSDSPNGHTLSRALPQRFSKLVPKLKASDFDYIIFDMPPVSQISVTPRLAGFMDMVLLVLESEKTSLDVAERGIALLAESRSHIGAVLNKTRTYVPQKLHQEFLSDS